MASGPIQPMNLVAQGNLRQMRGEVQSWNPEYPPWMTDQSINNYLRSVVARPRLWSGLLVKSQIVIPDAYTTGTVTVTRNSPTVTGSSTVWATNDVLNTTMGTAVAAGDLNLAVTITPASMGTNSATIIAGDWLTVDGGTGSEEQVLVRSTTSTTFNAVFTKAHLTSGTIWKSSLMRLQFRTSESNPWYSVKGVSSTTSLVLNDLWGGATASAQSYSIFKGYHVFGQDCRMVLSVVNLQRQQRLALHISNEMLNVIDPNRSASESTYLLADMSPDEVGRPQYEMYPRPLSSQVFSCLYARHMSTLSDDDDTAPLGMRSDVLVKGAIADALRWRPKNNKHYDSGTALQIATQKMMEFERGVQEMIIDDDNHYLFSLMRSWGQFAMGGGGYNWAQSHEVSLYDT